MNPLQDYSHLTETTDCRISCEQLRRMVTRYMFASEYCQDADVLEVGCGVGQGLGILQQSARSLIAGDYTIGLVNKAKEHYRDRIDIRQFDAQNMPFAEHAFDVVILFEAIYYLPEPQSFLAECRRVLRPDGRVLICSANKDWFGFAPSPASYRYFSASELHRLMSNSGFRTELFGDCPVTDGSFASAIVSAIRRIAVKFNMIPHDMRSKEKFKRIFFGKLMSMPAELQKSSDLYQRPMPIPHNVPNHDFKVIFAVGQKTDIRVV